eukprot:1786106-Rhodomonas_salina.1
MPQSRRATGRGAVLGSRYPIVLRNPYAISGTDLAYALPGQRLVLRASSAVMCYAAATPPLRAARVLRARMAVPQERNARTLGRCLQEGT